MGGGVLVFSSFVSFLKMIEKKTISSDDATTTGLLDGSLARVQRDHLIRKFQAGEIDVLFCSLKAAGVGIARGPRPGAAV